jgi:hypothetical protein
LLIWLSKKHHCSPPVSLVIQGNSTDEFSWKMSSVYPYLSFFIESHAMPCEGV